jgi:glycosyltransferase involved in cell wall biosynthesis
MRIACIATSRVPSSTANSIQLMKACAGLAAQPGISVHLYVPRKAAGSTGWDALAAHYGISTRFEIDWLPVRPSLHSYDFVFSALNRARAEKTDLVYTWTLPAALLAARSGLPVILELHDRVTGRFAPWIFRRFLKTSAPRRILIITDALRARLAKEFGPDFSRADLQIAPNGTDLESYLDLPSAPQARRALGLPEGPTAAYTGHFYAGRGTDLLCSLAQAFPQVRFLWIGGRPEDVETWRQRLAAAGIHNVTLTGFVENCRLPLYQSAADFLLMPYERSIAGSSGGDSADICSPMKMFDYLAAGRVILSSDLPVFHEVLNASNAVLCPPEDPQAWAAALSSLLSDPAHCRALAQQARTDATRYTWIERERRAVSGF